MKDLILNENYVIRDGKFCVHKNTGFSVINKNDCLKFVLIGITPGNNQLSKNEELPADFGTIEYKFRMAFNGTQMRNNLQKMIEHVNEKIHPGILQELIDYYQNDINNLFKFRSDSIIDFTSLLKSATYKKSRNGVFKMFRTPKDIINNDELFNYEFVPGFKKDYDEFYKNKDVIFIACGIEVYTFLKQVLNIDDSRIVAIVHPSPNAINNIKSFLHDDKAPYNPERIKW